MRRSFQIKDQVFAPERLSQIDSFYVTMSDDPLERMRELREKNPEIYAKMGELGSGGSSSDS